MAQRAAGVSEKPSSCGCASERCTGCDDWGSIDASACLYPAAAARIAELEEQNRYFLGQIRHHPHVIELEDKAAELETTVKEHEQHISSLLTVISQLEDKAAKYDAGVQAISEKLNDPDELSFVKRGLRFALRALGAEPQEES